MRSTCDLCGDISADVRPGVVSWIEPYGQRYNAIDRCTDHDACRERVLAKGEHWPIVEPIDIGAEARP